MFIDTLPLFFFCNKIFVSFYKIIISAYNNICFRHNHMVKLCQYILYYDNKCFHIIPLSVPMSVYFILLCLGNADFNTNDR